jgi:hypothetical protein
VTKPATDLAPYRGYFCTGISFASGHSVLLFNFAATPTAVGPINEVWVCGPDGQRLLFVSPKAGGDVVKNYHRFEQILGARIVWTWPDADTLEIAMNGEDGTALNLKLAVRSTMATRALGAVVRGTPRLLLRTAPMAAVSSLGMKLLLGVCGVRTVGRTETGRRFYAEPERIIEITSAVATRNGHELGPLSPPRQTITFGDLKVPDKAFIAEGVLFLEALN